MKPQISKYLLYMKGRNEKKWFIQKIYQSESINHSLILNTMLYFSNFEIKTLSFQFHILFFPSPKLLDPVELHRKVFRMQWVLMCFCRQATLTWCAGVVDLFPSLKSLFRFWPTCLYPSFQTEKSLLRRWLLGKYQHVCIHSFHSFTS